MPLPFSADIPEVPAVPSRTISHGWLRRLIVNASDGPTAPAPDTIDIDVCGYVPDTGEIVHGVSRRVVLPLGEAMQHVPEAADAMKAVLAAVPALELYAQSREK